MGTRFIEGTRYARILTVDREWLAQLVTELVQKDTGELFVAESEAGTLTGMIGLSITRSHIDASLGCTELFWWVEPNFRGSKTAIQLLRTAESWARSKGAKWIQVSAPEPKVARFYERNRYEYVESLYQRSL